MIDRGHDLPLIRQADLLGLSRGSLYYQPRAVPAADLAVMCRIDELHLDYPFAGSRMLRDLLRGEGISIGRERVASMMLRMGIENVDVKLMQAAMHAQDSRRRMDLRDQRAGGLRD